MDYTGGLRISGKIPENPMIKSYIE